MLKVKEKAKYCPRPNLKQKGIVISQQRAIRRTEPEDLSASIRSG